MFLKHTEPGTPEGLHGVFGTGRDTGGHRRFHPLHRAGSVAAETAGRRRTAKGILEKKKKKGMSGSKGRGKPPESSPSPGRRILKEGTEAKRRTVEAEIQCTCTVSASEHILPSQKIHPGNSRPSPQAPGRIVSCSVLSRCNFKSLADAGCYTPPLGAYATAQHRARILPASAIRAARYSSRMGKVHTRLQKRHTKPFLTKGKCCILAK